MCLLCGDNDVLSVKVILHAINLEREREGGGGILRLELMLTIIN